MNHSSIISFPKPLSPAEARIVWRITDKGESFTSFIFREKVNRIYLGVALACTVIQFMVFKFLYPFPDFFSDSYSYIYAAYAHLDVNIWPIGYSKFLAAFHTITHSGTALVGFQYFFLELSAIYFFFTWTYFFRPERNSEVILFLFLFFNPLFLYLSNYVNSDPFFLALSIWWCTELLWILYKPSPVHLLLQAVALFLCFTVRNNAYIYPPVSIAAIALSNLSWPRKALVALVGPILILLFILNTRNAAEDMTGTPQYSLFTGWQLANNSLYFRGDIPDTHLFTDKTLHSLDTISVNFFRRHPDNADFRDMLSDVEGNFFIKYQGAPLKTYFLRNYSPSTYREYAADWGKASALFAQYGSSLLSKYPLKWVRYFALPNTKNYFLPPLEKLRIYNMGEHEIEPVAQRWFNISPTVTASSFTFQGSVLYLFPQLFLAANILAIVLLGEFVIKKKYRSANAMVRKSILIIAFFLSLNFLFSISSTIIVFRYEIFPLILLFLTILSVNEASANAKKSIAKPK